MAELESTYTTEINATQKLTLEELNKSIKAKRKGIEMVSLDKIHLQKYDIRTERNVEQMMESLKHSDQLKPLTLSYSTKEGIYWLIDGRTRFIAMSKLHELTLRMRWKEARAEIYVDLTIPEQDYLNASINANQKTLTSDEKFEYVKKYKTEIEPEDLAKALNLSEEHIRDLISVARMVEDNPEVEEFIKQTKKGRGRGSLDIQTASYVAKVKDGGAQIEFAKQVSKYASERNITDRAKRRVVREQLKKINDLTDHKEELDLTSKEVVRLVVEGEDSNAGLISPENSYEKFIHYKDLLKKESFEEIIFANIQSPKMLNTPDGRSMAKITLDYARQRQIPITMIDGSKMTCDLWKAKEDINVMHKYVEQFLETDFQPSKNKTLMVWHLSGNRNARELLDTRILRDIGIIRPKAILVFILTEEWTTPSCEWSNTLERIRTFGILKGKTLKNMEMEDYFNAIESELQNKVKFTIIWEKRKQRRVALIRADFSVNPK